MFAFQMQQISLQRNGTSRLQLHGGTENEGSSARLKKLKKSKAQTRASFLQGNSSMSEPPRWKKMHTETSDIRDTTLPTRNKYCRAAPPALSSQHIFAMLCMLPFSSSSAGEMPGSVTAACCHRGCKPLHCSPFQTNCETELEAASSSLK